MSRSIAVIYTVIYVVITLGLAISVAHGGERASKPIRIVAFGDSLTAGYLLGPLQSFPAQLQAALDARGLNVEVANAGVSGDTVAAGLARLDWAVPAGTDMVIVELGANDALRGLSPANARSGLDQILTRLKSRGIALLLTGMRAPEGLGPDYAKAFDSIYSDLAQKHGVALYPFFLDGVALDAGLNLSDGLHPNAKGVAVIVQRILPSVLGVLEQVKRKRDGS